MWSLCSQYFLSAQRSPHNVSSSWRGKILKLTSTLAIVIRPEEMIKYFKLAKPLAVLYAPALAEKVEAIKALCALEDSGVDPKPVFVDIQTTHPAALRGCIAMTQSQIVPTAGQIGSLFFTSGTSGNQKGVVHSLQALLASARERIETWKLTEDDIVLNQKPANWMGGIFGIIPSLISGACL